MAITTATLPGLPNGAVRYWILFVLLVVVGVVLFRRFRSGETADDSWAPVARWIGEERASHGWGFLAMGIAFLAGSPAIAHQFSPHKAPWWVWPGLIAGAVFFVLGAAILLVPVYAAIRPRIPYTFRKPIVRSNAVAKVKAPPVELGRLDFQLFYKRANAASIASLVKMTKQTNRNTKATKKQTTRVLKTRGKSLEHQRRVVDRGGRIMQRHARRLARLERAYRAQITEVDSYGRKMLALDSSSMGEIKPGTIEWRVALVGGRDSTVEARGTIRSQREMNVSQGLNRATDELIAVLDRTIEDHETMITYCDWVIEHATP